MRRRTLQTLVLTGASLVTLALLTVAQNATAAEHDPFELHITQKPLVKNPPPPKVTSKGEVLPAPAIVLIDNTVWGCADSTLYLRQLPPTSAGKDQAPKDYKSFFAVQDNQVMRPNAEQKFDFVCLEVK